MGTVGESTMDCTAPRAEPLSVTWKEILGWGREEQLTKQLSGLTRQKYYSNTSGTGYCCCKHPNCWSSFWSFSGKCCVFYRSIPFCEWGKFSLWAPVSSGLVSGKGMMSGCQQMTPLNSDMAFTDVNQVQGKRVIKFFLFLFLSCVAVTGHWQRQDAGLEGILVWSRMIILIPFYGHIHRVLSNVVRHDFALLNLFSLKPLTSWSSRCFIIPF